MASAAIASRLIWNEKQASWAVAGVPSDHFMPSRILKVHDVPSAARSHDSAKPGAGSASGPKPTSRS